MVQHRADHCPKCDSIMVDGLAQDGGIRRFQCRACGELYTAIMGAKSLLENPNEPVNRLPDDPAILKPIPTMHDGRNERLGEEIWESPFRRTALLITKAKEETMANGTCPDCGKTGIQVMGKHRRFCPSKGASTKPTKNGVGAEKPSLVADTLLLLKETRAQRATTLLAADPEIQALDAAISALNGGARPS